MTVPVSVTDPASLRAGAEALAAPLPPLLIEAQRLAQTVILGDHGRRQPGHGTEFWQYRAALPGDPARLIDWRRSARSDAAFVQDKEWQAAQTLLLWADGASSMRFASGPAVPAKHHRAALLGLALAVLAVRGGERVGLLPSPLSSTHPPRRGHAQLVQIAHELGSTGDAASDADFGAPDADALMARARAVFLSDFMGDLAPLEAALQAAATQEVSGVLVHVLDPAEEAFPFRGRTIFESMTGALRHETLDAAGLRARYLQRLAERKLRLRELAQAAGWQLLLHHTDTPAAPVLMALWSALSLRRGL